MSFQQSLRTASYDEVVGIAYQFGAEALDLLVKGVEVEVGQQGRQGVALREAVDALMEDAVENEAVPQKRVEKSSDLAVLRGQVEIEKLQ